MSATSMRRVVRAAYAGRLAGSKVTGASLSSASGSTSVALVSPRKTMKPSTITAASASHSLGLTARRVAMEGAKIGMTEHPMLSGRIWANLNLRRRAHAWHRGARASSTPSVRAAGLRIIGLRSARPALAHIECGRTRAAFGARLKRERRRASHNLHTPLLRVLRAVRRARRSRSRRAVRGGVRGHHLCAKSLGP